MATSPHLQQARDAAPMHHVQKGGEMALLRDFPMRADNKEAGWSVPYDQLFHQYVDTDFLELSSDNTAEGTSSSDDLSNFFDVSSSNGSAAAKTLSIPNWEARNTEPKDAWQQAWSYIGSNPTSAIPEGNQASIYPESRGKAAASDPGLFNFEEAPCTQVASDPFVFSSSSSPYPALSCSSKKFHSLPTRSKRREPLSLRRTVSRESLSSKMMRPSQYRTGYQEVWAKRVGAPPLSPPPSSKVSQEENRYGYAFPASMHFTNPLGLDDDMSLSGQNYTSRPQIQITPVASPTSQAPSSARSSFNQPNDSTNPYLTHDLSEALQTPPHSDRIPSSSWTQSQNASFEFSFPPTQSESQPWWSAQPSSQSSYQQSRMDTMPISTAPSDLATSGLMIQCDSSSMPNMLEAHSQDGSFPTSSPVVYSSQMYTANAMPPYGHAHTQPQQLTPPSRSPTSSPTGVPYVRSRRSSSQRPPMAAAAAAAAVAAAAAAARGVHSSHHHHHNNHHRRKSSSGNGSGVGGRPTSVGFVNYTPDDSRKILTGVAPSGSSKTKARREKEAAEKRRRLSQAAARAIIEAGGDITTLEREGLLFSEAAEHHAVGK